MNKRITMKRFLYFFVFFLLLTLSLFYLLNIIGTRTLRDNLIHSSMNQIEYADSILDSVVSEASLYGMQYTVDERVRLYYREKQRLEAYDAQMKKNDIHDRMVNALISSTSIESLSIYWRTDGDFITTSRDLNQKDVFKDVNSQGWQLVNGDLYYFSVSAVMKPSFQPSDIQYIVGIKLKREALTNLLSQAINSDSSNAFFLIDGDKLISDKPIQDSIAAKVKESLSEEPSIQQMDYHSNYGDYYILSKYSPQIDTYLITYTKVSDLLVPLNRIRQVFFLSIAVIFLIGLTIILIFYRSFYRSVYLLDKKFSQVEQGLYGTRITVGASSEFSRLFKSFNHMVSQIQSLFASLKRETELRKSAEFKQLQAQINPHFLYNSLFYIISVARTSPESVEQMSKHLAEYYRYLTKLGSREVTFQSELKLADHYLSIMSLCKDLTFNIQLPTEVEDLPIMPLIIQPMVENAIQHGIEGRVGAHRVAVDVIQQLNELQIQVSDDGNGLEPDEIMTLMHSLQSLQESEGSRGTGLWNVNQRLKNAYGNQSGLTFHRNNWGGVTVIAHLNLNENEEGNYAIIDRG